MNNSEKKPEGLPPFLPKCAGPISIGVIFASVVASVYCLFSGEKEEKRKDITTPEPASKIIQTPEKK